MCDLKELAEYDLMERGITDKYTLIQNAVRRLNEDDLFSEQEIGVYKDQASNIDISLVSKAIDEILNDPEILREIKKMLKSTNDYFHVKTDAMESLRAFMETK
jgi:chromosomal replication initiation ATPase DnaA